MAGNDDDNVVGGGVAKWRVVSVLNGQEVDCVLFSRFADARVWAISTAVESLAEDLDEQGPVEGDEDEDEDEVWHVLKQAEVNEAFANGEWSCRAAWFGPGGDAGTYVQIERLVVA